MKGKRLSHRMREWLGSVAFIGPSFLGVAVFFIIPFGIVFFYALVDNPIQHNFVFFENFINVFKNTAFQDAAKNTMRFSIISVPLAVILSLMLALMLERNIPFKSQFRTFFLSPMMVPVASIVLIWQVVFNNKGALNGVLAGFGMQTYDWFSSDYNQMVVIILFLWKNLGYNMILFMSALNNIPNDLLEMATIEGAGTAYKFFKVKIRYLSPTILFVAILSMISSFKVFREVYLLTGDYPYGRLYMLQHFMNNNFRNLDYQKLSAAAIIMAAAMIIIIAVLFIIENYFGRDVEG